MELYHGSYTEIDVVDLSKCEQGKDFGQGFYVTKIREQAEIWAARKSGKMNTKGVVTEFNFDESFFDNDMLKVLRFDDYTDEWLDFVVLNRRNNTKKQVHDYDIVEGPVANDRIVTQIYDFLNGNISREQFLNELVHNPSHQICFCTVQALQALSLSHAKRKINIIIYHIDDEILQTLMTDCEMNELDATDRYYTSQTYSLLADETTELYKKTWQEIYQMLKRELNI